VLVHLSHLQLVFEVGAGAQTLHDGGHSARPDEVDHQTRSGLHPQIGQVCRRLLDHGDPLVEVEHPLLGGIRQDGHHHLVELGRGALEDVNVAQRHRVE
jgi:hypothetical protein